LYSWAGGVGLSVKLAPTAYFGRADRQLNLLNDKQATCLLSNLETTEHHLRIPDRRRHYGPPHPGLDRLYCESSNWQISGPASVDDLCHYRQQYKTP
jgi:hypothetical protein